MKRIVDKRDLKAMSETLKLIKSVYPKAIYVSSLENNLVTCANFEGVNPIFRASYFQRLVDTFIPELHDTIVDVSQLYDSIKNKMISVEVLDNGWISAEDEKGDARYIAHTVSDAIRGKAMGDTLNKFKPYFNIITAEDNLGHKIYEYDVMPEEIARLVAYDTVTFRAEPESDIALILTCKCFPNIKKCGNITIQWFVKGDEGRLMFLVNSIYGVSKPVWFTMLGEALRC